MITTEKEFNELNDVDKYMAIYEQAVFQMYRQEDGVSYLLYQLEQFYIEVKYYLDEKEIASVQTFTSVHLLEPYLELIRIPLYW